MITPSYMKPDGTVVLIETLWNVNLALKMTWDIKSVVLIETLWNVNSNPAIALTVHPWY